MASTGATSHDEFPGSTSYSTTSDEIHDRDHAVREFPRGRVAPAEVPDEAKPKKEKGKPDRPVDRPVDSQVLVDPSGTREAERAHPAFPQPEKKRGRWAKRLIFLAIVGAVLGVALYHGIPALQWALSTTSTDDAFVSGHTTNAGPRIEGIVTEVLVEQNDRVEPGTLLARLDREPFEISVRQTEASLDQSRSNLRLAKAQVKSQLASARAAFFTRKNQQEQLRRQVKSLEAQVAALRTAQSSQHLAEVDQRRLNNLTARGSASQSELDQRNNALDGAVNQVKQAWTAIAETRAALGLGPDEEHPEQVPADLLQQQSGIQTANSSIAQALEQIGIDFDAHDIKPGEAFEQILHMDSSQGLQDAFGQVVERAPAVLVAKAAVSLAESNLANSKLNLSWTEIRSEVAGFIQDRQANPGNRVEPGQTMFSIRPDYVWVDANYKETQLHHIKIGMKVDLHVDAYPGKVFQGRVSGFNPGTGLSESLLPPENATGNYIKVTQRLPVRIELVEPNPKDTPLFIGLSVVPYVKFKEPLDGPDAGQRIHPDDYRQHPDVGDGPAGRRSANRVDPGGLGRGTP